MQMYFYVYKVDCASEFLYAHSFVSSKHFYCTAMDGFECCSSWEYMKGTR